jgi:hypothetical protein
VVPGAGDDIEKPALAVDPAKPAVAPKTKVADQPVKRSGQVAVFVSRKEKKIFVRQGFIPLFEMPVTIEELDRPLGTHVFTAIGLTDQGAGMRWNPITVPRDTSAVVERRIPRRMPAGAACSRSRRRTKPPSTGGGAEGIQMPQRRRAHRQAADPRLVAGGVRRGLGKETGRYTEFIVLTR